MKKTANKNSKKDSAAYPESPLNSNQPVTNPKKFPESNLAKDEKEKIKDKKKKDIGK